MVEELAALDKTHMWDLVPLLSKEQPISCKCICCVKTWSDVSLRVFQVSVVCQSVHSIIWNRLR